MRNKLHFIFLIISLVIAIPCYALGVGNAPDFNTSYLSLVSIIYPDVQKLCDCQKIGLPLVTSEILAGVALGNLHYFGIQTFAGMENNEIIRFLAEIAL